MTAQLTDNRAAYASKPQETAINRGAMEKQRALEQTVPLNCAQSYLSSLK